MGDLGKSLGERRLRQGDPLSPFLFIVVVDVLGRMVEKAIEGLMLKGFEVGTEKVCILHNQFAVDTLFFMDGKEDYFFNTIRILMECSWLVGLKVNMGKSLLLGINMDLEAMEDLASSIRCSTGVWPMSYLGLPLGGNPRK